MNLIERVLNENPILETENLKIYPCKLNPKTIIELFEIYSDSQNVKFYTEKINDINEFTQFMMGKINGHQNHLKGYIAFIIELKKENKIIGLRNIILDGVYNFKNERKDNNKNITIEIIINKKYWGNNYSLESSEAIFKYLLEKGVEKIGTFINKNNTPALAMSKSLGFVETNSSEFIKTFGFHKDFEILCSDLNNSQIFVKNLV